MYTGPGIARHQPSLRWPREVGAGEIDQRVAAAVHDRLQCPETEALHLWVRADVGYH